MSIHWPIIRTCLGSPLGTAVVDDQRSYKRIGILAAAMMLADDLERRVQTEHVGIMLPSSGAFPIAALAVWMLGKVPVPLNFLLKPDELNYIVQDSGIDTIVTAKGMLDFLGYTPTGVVDGKPPAVEGGVKIRLLEEVDFRCVPSPRVPALMDDDALGVLLYTSGTSGRPKGVMLT
ncbi:MAG: AMP-binding protein, partial [Phycisphaerales bacterium]